MSSPDLSTQPPEAPESNQLSATSRGKENKRDGFLQGKSSADDQNNSSSGYSFKLFTMALQIQLHIWTNADKIEHGAELLEKIE